VGWRIERRWLANVAARRALRRESPMTGRACINGHYKGYHRDASGAEWLDDE
jgi:hypothetical protein